MSSDEEGGGDAAARETLRRLMQQSGRTAAELSRAVRRNHAYIQQYLKRGSPTRLPDHVRMELGRLLDVDPNSLAGDSDRPRKRRGKARRSTLNDALVRRSMTATAILLQGFSWRRSVEADVFSAVYALLERRTLADDSDTLDVVRRMLEAVRQATDVPANPTT
jgi:hypothetical protein